MGRLNREQYNTILDQLVELNRKVDLIMGTEVAMAGTFDDIVAEVAAEKDFDASVATFVANLEAQLTKAGPDPAAIQAVLDGMLANKAVLAAAITTPGPATPPGPTPA